MLVYTIAYIVSYILSRISFNKVSGIVLIFAAIYIYRKRYKESSNLLDLLGIYGLGFVAAQGIACFKLSYLQNKWSTLTWLCLYLAYICPYITYCILNRRFKYEKNKKSVAEIKAGISKRQLNIIFVSVILLTVVSLGAFITEVAVLSYIPFFVRGVPHAYSYFHIRGVHYFTVSCVLIPSVSVIYTLYSEKLSKIKITVISTCILISVLIPILCVSRFQLIFALICAVLTIIAIKKDIPLKLIIYTFLLLSVMYVILTVARSHDVEYLNSIFEMRYDLPIFISQPYIYISNNYDNFNYLVNNLSSFSFGLKSLYPIIALTGLKFYIPSLADFHIYVVKEELSTLTLIYDAYYDLGIVGIILFGILLGTVIYVLERLLYTKNNPIIYLIYAQITLYLMLAFFTTWFSNPTTWFYLGISVFIYISVFLKSLGDKNDNFKQIK